MKKNKLIPDDFTITSTRKGIDLSIYLLDKLNSYIKDNFIDEEEFVIAYGIDAFYSDCILNTLHLFRSKDETLDQVIDERMHHFTKFLKFKAEDNGFK